MLAELPPDRKAVAELILQGGIPAVRQAVEDQNAQAREVGGPEIKADALLAVAEELLPALRAAEWRDRAEAAAVIVDEISVRDLRAVVTGADTARDEEGRALAATLREALDRRSAAERQSWIDEITASLDDGRVVRALRISGRPPEPGVRFPAELAERLSDAGGEALAPETTADRWAAVLEAVVGSPVRRTITPRGLPAEPGEELTRTLRLAAPRVPGIAALLGEPIGVAPRGAPRPPGPRGGPGSSAPGRPHGRPATPPPQRPGPPGPRPAPSAVASATPEPSPPPEVEAAAASDPAPVDVAPVIAEPDPSSTNASPASTEASDEDPAVREPSVTLEPAGDSDSADAAPGAAQNTDEGNDSAVEPPRQDKIRFEPGHAAAEPVDAPVDTGAEEGVSAGPGDATAGDATAGDATAGEAEPGDAPLATAGEATAGDATAGDAGSEYPEAPGDAPGEAPSIPGREQLGDGAEPTAGPA